MAANIDLLIFSSFLIINLLVGLFYSGNVKNIQEYAIGDRNFSTPTIVATLVATYLGAGFFSYTLIETYRQGLYFLIPALGDPITFLITGYVLAPRMGEFLGKLSIAEAMGDLFGNKVKLITIIAGIIASIGILGVQFKVSAKVLELIFGTTGAYATIFSAAIAILYSAFGGIRAVTFTDVIQFFTFGCIIPIIAAIVWEAINDHAQVVQAVTTNPLFDFSQVFNFNSSKFYYTLSLLVYFSIPAFSPMVFQRVAMANNVSQLARSFKLAGFFCIFIQLVIAALAVFILSDNPNLDPNNLLNYIVNHYTYPGFKGLIAIGIMAMIMSTADSLINSTSVIFAHDLCKPMGFKWAQDEVWVSKIFSIISGGTAIFFALKLKSILDIFLMVCSFYMPVVTTPFLLAVLGFRSSEKSVLIGIFAAVITVIIWEYKFAYIGLESFVPGIIANIIFLFGSHYLLNQEGGWVGIGDKKAFLALKQDKIWRKKIFLNTVREFKIFDFIKQNIPQDSSTYCYLGFFSILSICMAMYSLSEEVVEGYTGVVQILYQSSLVLSCYFLMHPIWPVSFKKSVFASLTYLLGVFYILVLSPSMFVVISDFAQTQLMIFFINVVAMSIIFRWQIGLTMLLVGVLGAIAFYKYYLGIDDISITKFSVQLKITYFLLLLSSIIVIFVRPAQRGADKKLKLLVEAEKQINEISKQLLNLFIIKRDISHEIRNSINHVDENISAIHDNWDHHSEEQKKNYMEAIYRGYQHIKHKVNGIVDISGMHQINLIYKNVDFQELVQKALDESCELYLENQDIQFNFQVNATDLFVVCDEDKMMEAIKYLIKNAIRRTSGGLIEIAIDNVEFDVGYQKIEGIKFSITDEGASIPENELAYVFTPFSYQSNAQIEGSKLDLSICERIIQIHHGLVSACNNIGKPGARFEFIIPL